MSVYNALGSALYSKLTGGTALMPLLNGTASVYNLAAPFEAAYDYVIFNLQVGTEENDTAHRVKDLTIQVRGYSTELAKAGSIDSACDALLHNQPLTVTGWAAVLTPRRVQDIELIEYDEANRPIYTRGGLYDLKIEKV